MTKTEWGRAAFVYGPLCLVAYGLIRLIDQHHHPGLDWSTGHLALLAGVLLFAPAFLELRRMAVAGRGGAARSIANTNLVLGLLGVAAVTAQTVIDLIVGFCSADRVAMDDIYRRVQEVPGVEQAVYSVGPLLFYVALALFMTQLAVLRKTAFWRPLVIVAAIAVAGIGLDVMALSWGLVLLALARLEPAAEDEPAVGEGSGLRAVAQ